MPPSPSTTAASPMLFFGRFPITSSQIFHTTAHSFCFVNLKPLLPGHILVSPRRRVPRLADLSPLEIGDLFGTVALVGRTLQRVYGAQALNIAMQDGQAAGQSVPHVHAHVIPRRQEDAGSGDRVYGMLEGEEGDVGKGLRLKKQEEEKEAWGDGIKGTRPKFPTVDEAARKPRAEAEMSEEAQMLRREMERDRDAAG